MDVCLLWVLCVVRQRSLRRSNHSSRVVLPSVVCLSVIVKPRQWGGFGPLGGGGCCAIGKKYYYYYYYYYWYSALGPVWAETRVQSGDWYVSGTLHPGHVLRGSLPLLSPAFWMFTLFTTRCLHVRQDVRDPSGGSGNCGRECCPAILPKCHLGIFYMPQIYDMGPPALLPLRRKACWGFFSP